MINIKKNYLYHHCFADYVAEFFSVIFSLSAIMKLSNLEKFEAKLTALPVLFSVSGWLHWFVPVLEIAIALLLVFRKTSRIGLHLACWWFVLFTYFILLVINTGGVVPYFYGHSWLYINFGPQLLLNNTGIVLIAIILIKAWFRKKHTISF